MPEKHIVTNLLDSIIEGVGELQRAHLQLAEYTRELRTIDDQIWDLLDLVED